jgi:hypothetical protein
MTEHVRNYILPARSQCWDVCLSPIINTPSSSAVQVSQALVEGLDFEVVSIITTFDPSAPSFALPHDRRQIISKMPMALCGYMGEANFLIVLITVIVLIAIIATYSIKSKL